MDLDEVKLCFDLGENDVVFGLTPESLRTFCEQSAAAAPLFAAVLGSRLGQASDDAVMLWDRAGYLVAMTDKQHIAKLLRIAKDCMANCYLAEDEAETGYEGHNVFRNEGRSTKREAKLARPIVKSPTLASTARALTTKASTPGVAGSTLADGGQCNGSDGSADIFLLADLFNRQLNISVLFTGCGILTIRSGARQQWTEDAPLTISRISGIEYGTTTIQYVGQELHVTDIETFATVVRMGARDAHGNRVPLQTDVHLGEGALLRATRRGDATSYYVALREQIARLQKAKMIVRTTYRPLIRAIASAMPEDKDAIRACGTGELRLVVSLLGNATSPAHAESAGTITITIPPSARVFFGKGLSTWFKEDEYYRLKKPSSRRLYLLYRRHVKAWGFTRAELREYLGSSSSSDNGLQKTLQGAFTEMYETGVISFVPKYLPCKSRYGVRAYELDFGSAF